MRKHALSDKVLMRIDKPARYLGNEVNAVCKDADAVRIRFAMCFPDVYEIGMSHLGIQILYDMLNLREDTWCERVYSPWTDLDPIMREEGIPLFALESQDPIRDFDFLGITIQYEMCYTNILQILDLSQIPLCAKDRTGWDVPVVIGGGPCTYNPEPLADFFDIFYIGEGETVYFDLLDLYRTCREQGTDRREFLRQAAAIPGLYVPMFYDAVYHDDGTLASFTPNAPGVPAVVKRQVVTDLGHTYYPEKPLVPFIKVTQDRVVLEIMRGCIRGCRFCQAGMVYRPNRERPLDFLKTAAMDMLLSTGHEEISLSSLSSSDYSHLEDLLDYLIQECSARKINISLPSLRIDAFSLDVMRKVQDVRKSSLTFAPEAGTQRMRDVINKGLTREDILSGAAQAFGGGWNRVKLYFMLGLPMETPEDIEGIAVLCNEVAKTYYEIPKAERPAPRVDIVASSAFFVPKPFTPFQWAPQCDSHTFEEKAKYLKSRMKEQINFKSIKYNWHDADTSQLEGVLARGDRRVGSVILNAYRAGCIYDAWTENFRYAVWMQAFRDAGVDPDFYNLRERPVTELLPWDFIDIGVSKAFLEREWERARQGLVTPNCRERCSGCGSRVFGGGVCHEGADPLC